MSFLRLSIWIREPAYTKRSPSSKKVALGWQKYEPSNQSQLFVVEDPFTVAVDRGHIHDTITVLNFSGKRITSSLVTLIRYHITSRSSQSPTSLHYASPAAPPFLGKQRDCYLQNTGSRCFLGTTSCSPVVRAYLENTRDWKSANPST